MVNQNKVNGASNGTPNIMHIIKLIAYIVIAVGTIRILFFLLIWSWNLHGSIKEDVPYTEFMQYAKEGKIDTVSIALEEKEFQFEFKKGKKRDEKLKAKALENVGDDGSKNSIGNSNGKQDLDDGDVEIIYTVPNPKYENFKKDMLELGIRVQEKKDKESYTSYIFSGTSLFIMVLFLTTFYKQTHGDEGMGKRKQKKSNVTFQDVAGLEEVKQDLSTIVDFLKCPQKYKDAGAKLPKGIMLYGPPGTGKTLLAKALAGEAGVEFIAAVGSEFDERFVGVGAQRIRKLFEDAKKKAPCIIFIDEIDALGGKRNTSDSSSDRQTINQFLSEMDGYSTDENILVIGATNRLKDLDPALIRTGRFDSQFAVPLPANTKERKAIIDIYIENKKIGENVDLDLLAKETLGCSPADIETIINEAAILAAKHDTGVITKEDLDDAFYKQVMHGHKKKDLEREKDEIKVTAWHEAAHALTGILLGQDVTKATIIPSTSGAGGVTFFNQEKMHLLSKKELENKVVSLYAGRAAEELITGKDGITTGASSDITEATKIICCLIKNYGMSEYGMLDLDELKADQKEIDTMAKDIASTLYERTCKLVKKHEGMLEKIANILLEKETLCGDEIQEIIGK